jgi:hypothetical protein
VRLGPACADILEGIGVPLVGHSPEKMIAGLQKFLI